MNTVMYVLDKKTEDYFNYNNSKKDLQDKTNVLKYSHNIHLILIDDCHFRICKKKDDIKNNTIELLEKLIKINENDHIVIINYGYNIRIVTPVISIDKTIILPILHILWYHYDFGEFITREIAYNAIKSKSIILTNPEFSFLEKYDNVLIHEIF